MFFMKKCFDGAKENVYKNISLQETWTKSRFAWARSCRTRRTSSSPSARRSSDSASSAWRTRRNKAAPAGATTTAASVGRNERGVRWYPAPALTTAAHLQVRRISNIFSKTEIFSQNLNIFSQHASFANYRCSGSTPKQRQLVRTVSTDNYKEDSSLASQDAKNVNLSRQNKFIKGE